MVDGAETTSPGIVFGMAAFIATAVALDVRNGGLASLNAAPRRTLAGGEAGVLGSLEVSIGSGEGSGEGSTGASVMDSSGSSVVLVMVVVVVRVLVMVEVESPMVEVTTSSSTLTFCLKTAPPAELPEPSAMYVSLNTSTSHTHGFHTSLILVVTIGSRVLCNTLGLVAPIATSKSITVSRDGVHVIRIAVAITRNRVHLDNIVLVPKQALYLTLEAPQLLQDVLEFRRGHINRRC